MGVTKSSTTTVTSVSVNFDDILRDMERSGLISSSEAEFFRGGGITLGHASSSDHLEPGVVALQQLYRERQARWQARLESSSDTVLDQTQMESSSSPVRDLSVIPHSDDPLTVTEIEFFSQQAAVLDAFPDISDDSSHWLLSRTVDLSLAMGRQYQMYRDNVPIQLQRRMSGSDTRTFYRLTSPRIADLQRAGIIAESSDSSPAGTTDVSPFSLGRVGLPESFDFDMVYDRIILPVVDSVIDLLGEVPSYFLSLLHLLFHSSAADNIQTFEMIFYVFRDMQSWLTPGQAHQFHNLLIILCVRQIARIFTMSGRSRISLLFGDAVTQVSQVVSISLQAASLIFRRINLFVIHLMRVSPYTPVDWTRALPLTTYSRHLYYFFSNLSEWLEWLVTLSRPAFERIVSRLRRRGFEQVLNQLADLLEELSSNVMDSIRKRFQDRNRRF